MATERRSSRATASEEPQGRVRRKPAKEKPHDPPLAPAEPLTSVPTDVTVATPSAVAPIITGVESVPVIRNRPEGPRPKQIGVPEHHLIHLEPCFFPEDAQWLRTAVGLVLGVAVKAPEPKPNVTPGPVVISYNPTPVPRMRMLAITLVAELAAETPGAEAVCRLIVLNREGNPLAIGDLSKRIPLTGFPRLRFPIPAEQMSAETLLTVALEVLPVTPGARAVVRSLWAEIES